MKLEKQLMDEIEVAACDAEWKFWAAIAEAFPEIKTGDMAPEAAFAFSQACESAVREWYEWNRTDIDDDDRFQYLRKDKTK